MVWCLVSEVIFNVFYYLLVCGDGIFRIEFYFNYLVENNVFGIVLLVKFEEK